MSIENVDLHETVERQAVTDELTGLSNRRRFQEAMAAEVERSRRFGQPVGLVLLDLDDFKRVNDTYGHQQGDLVLREVARVLRETSREIDEPARYGGEELAVVLPGTDLEGAFNLAERVRERHRGARPAAARRRGASCASPRLAARPPCRARPTTCAGWSRRPTTRCTRPSARARTAPCARSCTGGCRSTARVARV